MNAPEDSLSAEELLIQRWGDSASAALDLLKIPSFGMMIQQVTVALSELRSKKSGVKFVSAEELCHLVRSLLPAAISVSGGDGFDPGLLLAQFIEAGRQRRRWGELDPLERKIVECWAAHAEASLRIAPIARDEEAFIPAPYNFLSWCAKHNGHVPWYRPDAVKQ